MFGKPEWFKAKTVSCCGMAPANWKGWTYLGTWGAILLVPTVSLLAYSLRVESMLWLAAAGGVLGWDLWQMRRNNSQTDPPAAPKDDVLVIDETETESARLATRNYDMHIRN